MPFAYYARLNRKQRAIYRRSDEIAEVPLAGASSLRPLIADLAAALEGEDRRRVEQIANALARGISASLEVAPISVKVLAVRPSRRWGELHGLYEAGAKGEGARISVWMRTARHRRVVAFRTFLRTLLHELCHHLDYELLGLEDSFHTQGFFKRESSLYAQLTGRTRRGAPA
jgi:hypothetical protein